MGGVLSSALIFYSTPVPRKSLRVLPLLLVEGAERRLEELEARLAEPVESPEPRETATDTHEGWEDPEDDAEPETASSRSWWRRLFGG